MWRLCSELLIILKVALSYLDCDQESSEWRKFLMLKYLEIEAMKVAKNDV